MPHSCSAGSSPAHTGRAFSCFSPPLSRAWFATHPSASLDDAGARFRHLCGLQRTLGTNG